MAATIDEYDIEDENFDDEEEDEDEEDEDDDDNNEHEDDEAEDDEVEDEEEEGEDESDSSESSEAEGKSNGKVGGGGAALSFVIEDFVPPSLQSTHDLRNTFQWTRMLSEPDFVASPVASFPHAPMADCWENIIVGMKVEVENRDSDSFPNVFSHAFWVATVLRISGYYALLRFEGFGQDGSKDFWISLCSDQVHPVGWCATKGKPLIPPVAIQSKYSDWKEFLVKRLTGARTLPCNFYAKVWESVGSSFRVGMSLEVVDKMRICQVRVATVHEVTGRRLYLQYNEVDHDDRGFWCHEESPLIHPVGWARRVGHQIVASQEYYDRCAMENYLPTDSTPDMFPEYRPPPGNFTVGMKLEAVDPLNLATFGVSSVMKVLRFGYIMIRMDGYENDATGSDWFCYHASSPLIFPPGFAEKNNIELKNLQPDKTFVWFEYLKETQSSAAPVSLFCQHRNDTKHGFKVGMKLECADQMDPRLICVGTINRVVGRLLRVHFDGWDSEYDQWMDCDAVDIYPVGWSELVGHKMEGPKMSLPAKEKKRKSVGRKGRKRTTIPHGSSSTAPATTTATSNPSSTSASTVVINGRKGKKAVASPANSPLPETSPLSPPAPQSPSLDTARGKQEGEDKPGCHQKGVTTEEQPATTTTTTVKVIPRLVDSAGQAAVQRGRDMNLNPNTWSVNEVTQFLTINECSSLVDAFSDKGIDGSQFLNLAKEDIMKLVNNKIGPCLKIENLLTLLRARLNPAQARFVATMRKTSL